MQIFFFPFFNRYGKKIANGSPAARSLRKAAGGHSAEAVSQQLFFLRQSLLVSPSAVQITTFGRRKMELPLPIRQPDKSGGQAAPRHRAKRPHLCSHRVLKIRDPRIIVTGRTRGRENEPEPCGTSRSFLPGGQGQAATSAGVKAAQPGSRRLPAH